MSVLRGFTAILRPTLTRQFSSKVLASGLRAAMSAPGAEHLPIRGFQTSTPTPIVFVNPSIKKFVEGNEDFRRNEFDHHKQLVLHSIENGQKPKALFIGCCDARGMPEIALRAKAGELFVCRTIGGFVPPYSPETDHAGTHSAIQYAINVLGVDDIILCGHTHCGACKALHQPVVDHSGDLAHLQEWLKLGYPARDAALLMSKPANAEVLYRRTERLAAVSQMQNLMTHPYVRRKVLEGRLFVHVWHYVIETGGINYYDASRNDFYPLLSTHVQEVQREQVPNSDYEA